MRHYENDNYGFDHIRWRRRINSLSFSKENYLENLKIIKNEIYLNADSAFAYFFARDFRIHQLEMCEVAISNLDYKYIYFFSKNIESMPIEKLENIILLSKNISIISKFSIFVKNINFLKFKNAILNSKNLKSYYMFIKNFDNINIDEFKNLILNSNKPKYVYELAKKLTLKKDLDLSQNIILNSNSFIYLKLYAQNIPSANISLFDKIIMKRNNKDEIKTYIKSIKKSKLINIINFI